MISTSIYIAMNWTYMCIYKYRYMIHTYIFLYFNFNILRLLSCASQCQRDFLDFDSCVGFLASWGIAPTGGKIPRRIRCHPLCRWCRWCAGWRPTTSRLWNGWVEEKIGGNIGGNHEKNCRKPWESMESHNWPAKTWGNGNVIRKASIEQPKMEVPLH